MWALTLEILICMAKKNGRCCSQDVSYGTFLEYGDICFVVVTQVQIQDVVEDAIKLVKIADSAERCIVGNGPRAYLKNAQVMNALIRQLQVLEF
jgi:hypothetical protein